MTEELWSKLHLQNHAEINGRGIYHYLMQTTIGNFNVVEYETPSKEIKRFTFDEGSESAERKFKACCAWVMKGK